MAFLEKIPHRTPHYAEHQQKRGVPFLCLPIAQCHFRTSWHVGGYVSAKLKSEEWGSKVVTQLSEYIRSQRPDIKGYSRRSIYNMVMFYEAYSTTSFLTTVENFLSSEFVQPATAQIGASNFEPSSNHTITVQPKTAQIV